MTVGSRFDQDLGARAQSRVDIESRIKPNLGTLYQLNNQPTNQRDWNKMIPEVSSNRPTTAAVLSHIVFRPLQRSERRTSVAFYAS
jgi:hypothetical protein